MSLSLCHILRCNSLTLSGIEPIFGTEVLRNERRKASAIYLVVMVTQLPWQPEWNLNNSSILSHVEFTFDMKVAWDNRHQSHTSLLL